MWPHGRKANSRGVHGRQPVADLPAQGRSWCGQFHWQLPVGEQQGSRWHQQRSRNEASARPEPAIHTKQLTAVALVLEEPAYTVRKWTRNLRTKIRKCVPTKRNRETNDAFQKHSTTGFIKRFNEMNCWVRKRCALSFHSIRVPSVIVCLNSVWDALRPSPAFCVRCTHRVYVYAWYTQKCALPRPLSLPRPRS